MSNVLVFPPPLDDHPPIPRDFKSGGGDGISGGMEPRVAKLEALYEGTAKDVADLKADLREMRRDMRSDFRVLFGAIIAVALGLAGIMAKGFGWL